MSKLTKLLAGVLLAAGVMLALPGAAQARWHGGWHHGWHGGWGWGPGFALGFGWGVGYPYRYYGPGPGYYYYGPDCGWVRVRAWRYNHWIYRRVWRCW